MYYDDVNVYDALSRLSAITPALLRFVNSELSTASKNERFMFRQLSNLQDKLENTLGKIEYLVKKVIAEGHLMKRSDGKYALVTDSTSSFWSCGRIIEFYFEDEDDDDDSEWILSRIEHGFEGSKDYYIVACPDLKLEGLRVRVRGEETEE